MNCVLVVDDDAGDHDRVATVLRHAGYTVLEAANGEFGLDLAGSERPDLVIGDGLLPAISDDELLRAVRSDPVTALPSGTTHRERLRELNARLLQKVEDLRDAVILCSALQEQADRLDQIVAGPVLTCDGDRLDQLLSGRELEVLAIIAEGETNAAIATRLVIADSTVQSHVKTIMRKLGVSNRTAAAVRYLRSQPRSNPFDRTTDQGPSSPPQSRCVSSAETRFIATSG